MLHFEDGSHAVGDLLVGCDGVHSVTRTIIDPDAPTPRYVGLLNFGGYTPGTAVGEEGAWHMIFGARAFFGYVPDAAGGTVWFANVPRHPSNRAERESTTAEQWKDRLIELFANDRGPATELIGAGSLQLAADNTHDLPSVPAWHKVPLIVIGDAAHAPSPSSGQGASMALEDGVVLAKCLRDRVQHSDGLYGFRTHPSQVAWNGSSRKGHEAAAARPPAPWVGLLRDLMLPFVFRHLVTEKSHGVDVRLPRRLEQSRNSL